MLHLHHVCATAREDDAKKISNVLLHSAHTRPSTRASCLRTRRHEPSHPQIPPTNHQTPKPKSEPRIQKNTAQGLQAFYKRPESYPTSCLLGCVDVVDCVPGELLRQQADVGEESTDCGFGCGGEGGRRESCGGWDVGSHTHTHSTRAHTHTHTHTMILTARGPRQLRSRLALPSYDPAARAGPAQDLRPRPSCRVTLPEAAAPRRPHPRLMLHAQGARCCSRRGI